MGFCLSIVPMVCYELLFIYSTYGMLCVGLSLPLFIGQFYMTIAYIIPWIVLDSLVNNTYGMTLSKAGSVNLVQVMLIIYILGSCIVVGVCLYLIYIVNVTMVLLSHGGMIHHAVCYFTYSIVYLVAGLMFILFISSRFIVLSIYTSCCSTINCVVSYQLSSLFITLSSHLLSSLWIVLFKVLLSDNKVGDLSFIEFTSINISFHVPSMQHTIYNGFFIIYEQ